MRLVIVEDNHQMRRLIKGVVGKLAEDVYADYARQSAIRSYAKSS